MAKIITVFLDLITIDSPSGKEEVISKYLTTKLLDLGFKVKADNLGQIFATSGNPKPLLLTAHMDTVEPGTGIKPKIIKGIIQSDGTTILGADNKACLAATLVAIEEFIEKNKKLPPIEVLFTVKEETGGGVDNFPFEWIKAKQGITFDVSKPLGKIAMSAPFIYNFSVDFTGKAAHSSRPSEGLNALSAAASFISKVKVGKIDKNTTVNIGKVTSGSGINTIPAHASVEGEVRSIEEKTFKKILKEIETVLLRISNRSKIKTSFHLSGYCPGYKYDKNNLFVKKARKILLQKKIKPEFYYSTGVSDANIIANKNIQFLCMSDGVNKPHTVEESITEKNLIGLKDLIYEFISHSDQLTNS